MTHKNTQKLKRGLAQMLKGGVIMDVVTAEQARIAQEAGAVAVMALERVPSDIRRDGGVARMSDPRLIKEIKAAVSIPVMAIALSLTTLRIYKIYYGKEKKIVYNIMASASGKIKTSLEKSAFCLLFLADFYVNLGCPADYCHFYLQYVANFVLFVSIIFAAFSLHHQIHEIS